jgi:hypothetical protein
MAILGCVAEAGSMQEKLETIAIILTKLRGLQLSS